MSEQETPTTPINTEEPTPITVPPNADELFKNYDSLVKQQQEQINQLIKQQELNSKVNKQLGEALKNQMEETNTNTEAPKEHWVDDVIKNDFVHQAQYDYSNETEPSGQVASWLVRYLKEREGCTNEEINNRMKSLFEFINTGKQIKETPKSSRPIPNEIKYR